MNKIQPNAWNCSICLEVMDGKNDKLVATSKRCLHIFHEVCIKDWINEGANTCPLCKLEDLHIEEILINHEHTKQYSKWDDDKEGYTYEKAFDEEYPNLDDTDRKKLKPIDVLVQRDLRGSERRETLSTDECLMYMSETLNKAKSNRNVRKDLFEKSVMNALKARRLVLKNLKNEYAELQKKANHILLLNNYEHKVSGIDSKVDKTLDYLRSLSYRDYYKICFINDFSKKVRKFSLKFIEAGKFDDSDHSSSIDRSQEILMGIDKELDDFVSNQPQIINNSIDGNLDAVVKDNVYYLYAIQDDKPIIDPKKDPNPNGKYLLAVSIAVLAMSIFAIHKIYHSYHINDPKII